MTTLADTTLGGRAEACSAGRALLERAVGAAPSNVPRPRGLRRLFARDQSAAALIRRYRLLPAIENAYERVSRESGPVTVEVSAEDGDGKDFVMVIFLCDSLDFDRMFDLSAEIAEAGRSLIGERHWYRLVTCVEPGPECEADR
jgi:hypothetical protein